MNRNLIGELWANLLPAVLAGVIGGLGAYVAVKVDIAVLLSNQAALMEQGKVDVVTVGRHDSELKLVNYRVNQLTEDVNKLNGMVIKR